MIKNTKITKAVIPAAGLGTRILPITKAIPKEIIPIINVPVIQYIVKEAIDSGIREILLVISKGKETLAKYFTSDKKLEKKLLDKNKHALYQIVHNVGNMAKIKVIYQDQQLGLGHAIGFAKKFVNNEPFAVLLGDDVVWNSKNPNALKQCIDAYNKTKSSIVGVQQVNKKDVSKYGIIGLKNKKNVDKNIFEINDMVEKPNINQAPSCYAILGRYVLTPNIFKMIEKTKKDKSGEIQLTNALKKLLLNNEKVYACNFTGTRYDLGNKLGIAKAVTDFALRDEEIKTEFKKYLQTKKFN